MSIGPRGVHQVALMKHETGGERWIGANEIAAEEASISFRIQNFQDRRTIAADVEYSRLTPGCVLKDEMGNFEEVPGFPAHHRMLPVEATNRPRHFVLVTENLVVVHVTQRRDVHAEAGRALWLVPQLAKPAPQSSLHGSRQSHAHGRSPKRWGPRSVFWSSASKLKLLICAWRAADP